MQTDGSPRDAGCMGSHFSQQTREEGHPPSELPSRKIESERGLAASPIKAKTGFSTQQNCPQRGNSAALEMTDCLIRASLQAVPFPRRSLRQLQGTDGDAVVRLALAIVVGNSSPRKYLSFSLTFAVFISGMAS